MLSHPICKSVSSIIQISPGFHLASALLETGAEKVSADRDNTFYELTV